jgi:hypothetical protein
MHYVPFQLRQKTAAIAVPVPQYWFVPSFWIRNFLFPDPDPSFESHSSINFLLGKKLQTCSWWADLVAKDGYQKKENGFPVFHLFVLSAKVLGYLTFFQ